MIAKLFLVPFIVPQNGDKVSFIEKKAVLGIQYHFRQNLTIISFPGTYGEELNKSNTTHNLLS